MKGRLLVKAVHVQFLRMGFAAAIEQLSGAPVALQL